VLTYLLTICTDDIHESMKDAATDAQAVSRRDMATQMSPEGSIRFSPERQCSFSPSSPSPLPISELLNAHSNRAEVKDLQVDEKVTVTRWSKKHRGLYHGNGSKMRDHVHGKATNHEDLTWYVLICFTPTALLQTHESE